jgi:sialate O-acetylesterase
LNDWRNAAANGHELGNHTLFHPCDGQLPGRSWVSSEKDLSKYTPERTINEIKVMEAFLQAVDGKKIRTFAYPCGDMVVDSVNYYDSVQTLFAGARGVWDGMQTINEVELKKSLLRIKASLNNIDGPNGKPIPYSYSFFMA